MRRARLTWRVVAGIGVLLLVCGTATVWAGDGPKTKQLHLLIKVTATTAVDVDGSGGASVGDTLVEQGDLYTADGKTKVGDGYAVCTQVTADQSTYDCQGSDSLPGGFTGVGGSVTGTTIDATTIDYTISLTQRR